MNKSTNLVIIGSMLVIFAATFSVVIWPTLQMAKSPLYGPSAEWRQSRIVEEQGRALYIANGCTYCHSQYVRPQDWGLGAERIAKAGDYYNQTPHLLGSERTGPDLSQEGGEHPDDWHIAHFQNPRYTRTRSLMPSFAYEGKDNINALTAYVQSLGYKLADIRVADQRRWKAEAVAAYKTGPDANVRWLHSRVPESWRPMKSQSTASRASVMRGEKIYVEYCMGCHGPVGDGMGPAAPYLNPPPLNFTLLSRHLIDGKYIGGILYYQIMNGITGTAMPYFKKELESAKIWDVGNYVSVNFINYRDDMLPSVGIPPAYEGVGAAPSTPQPNPGPLGANQGAVR